MKKISVIVPAHNEAAYLDGCLAAVSACGEHVEIEWEVIVVLNRCTDGTRQIAESYGAVCIEDTSRCIAVVRNKGVAAASGDIIITCDADSRLHPLMFKRVLEELAKPNVVGGGVSIRWARRSLGIAITERFVDAMAVLTGVTCGAFWTTKTAFESIGGFDEQKLIGKDVDFALRLKRWGKQQGRCYQRIKDAPLTTSSRKFDHFGDWILFKMLTTEALRIRRSIKGADTDFVDEYFYDFNDKK